MQVQSHGVLDDYLFLTAILFHMDKYQTGIEKVD
jgi:hypothetical protein